MTKLLISTITPVYSGEEYLEELIEQLNNVRTYWIAQNYPVCLSEAIFVNDGAIDNSGEVLSAVAKRHSWVKVITLSRNYGQHPATIAGILHSSGDWVITLDEDLQHKPNHIFEFLIKALENSSDIVYATPLRTIHKSIFRDFSSKFYKNLIAYLTNSPQVRYFNSFRLIRGSIARAAASVSGHDMYFDVSLSWFTNNVTVLTLHLIDERYAQKQQSGYGIKQLLSHARRLIVSSHVKILRLSAFIGLIFMTIGVLYGFYVVFVSMLYPEALSVKGWSSMIAVMLFSGGLFSFLLAVLLEYTSIILLQSQGRPTFFTVDRSQDKAIFDLLKGIKD